MLKLIIILLIVVFPAIADDYVPPSPDEIMGWWNSLTYEKQISELQKLDAIEHAVPKISTIKFSAILSKNGDLYIKTEPFKIGIDYLEYEIEIDVVKIESFYKTKREAIDYILPIATGIGASFFGVSISEKALPWQYGIAALGGAGLGLILIFRL